MGERATTYAVEPLQIYLDDAASGKPAPGGGSVSAFVGALGAALVAMVCNLTIGKEKYADAGPRMEELVAKADDARGRLQRLLQDDTVAYNGVIAAYRLPKDTEEQRAARAASVQAGLIMAADVPLDICRVAVEVCRLSKVAAEIGNPNAVTDAGIGAILGEAAAQGAALNVKINLGSIKDADYVRRAASEIETILTETAALRAEVLHITHDKL
ncbi:MAG TPA: cyclodeaminase/cyclohydrolase family protein [Thermoleophilia bacterium]